MHRARPVGSVRLMCAAAALFLVLLSAAPARAGNYAIYIHGRDMKGWIPQLLFLPSGWQHLAMTYNGSSRISNATARTQVRETLATYCRGSHQCVILCYSAGCARVLKAIDELRSEVPARTPDRILFIEATASAAGGTELASLSTKWWLNWLVRLLGLHADVDYDLTPNAMRSTYGYIQNRSNAPMYHVAGHKNFCINLFLFIKICGGWAIPGVDDGILPVHSTCGFSTIGQKTDCCSTGAKYTNRTYEQCATFAKNHTGMVGIGLQKGSMRFGLSYAPTTGEGYLGSAPEALNHNDDTSQKVNGATIAGVLNVTPPDTDADGRPDGCIACDAAGCAKCREFSVASSGYTLGCNGYTCTPTVSGSGTYWGAETITTPTSTQVKFTSTTCGLICITNTYTMNLLAGVTVTRSTSGTLSGGCPTILESVRSASTQLIFRYKRGGCFGQPAISTQDVILTFTGVTVFGGTLANPTAGLTASGNILTFTKPALFAGQTEVSRFYLVKNTNL